MRKTDWLQVKRGPNGEVKIIPDGRKKMGCASMSRGWCPRCLDKGNRVSGQFLGAPAGKKMDRRWKEHYRCPECGFEWVWDRQFKGGD